MESPRGPDNVPLWKEMLKAETVLFLQPFPDETITQKDLDLRTSFMADEQPQVGDRVIVQGNKEGVRQHIRAHPLASTSRNH